MTLPALIPVGSTTIHSAATAFAEAVEMLGDLPDTPEKIAALFEGIGLKGYPCSGTECALAEYVRATIWPDDDIEVSIMDMALHVEFGLTEFLYSLPPHLTEFVSNFDDGKFPALMREECFK